MTTPRILAVLLIPLLLSGCLVSKKKYEQQVVENQRLSQKAGTLETQRNALRTDLNSAEADKARLNRELLDLAERLARQQENWRLEVQALQQALDNKDSQLDELYRESDSLAADKVALSNQLEKEKVARAARIATLKNTYDQLVGALETELERERAAREARAAELRKARAAIASSLESEMASGTITLWEKEDQLTIKLSSALLFNSGRADVNEGGQAALKKVGKALASLKGRQIRVEGHTDSIPIKGPLAQRFPSNWELSTARASSVVRFLQNNSGIEGKQLAAVGLGPYRPEASNKTPEGRAQNRRIEIVVVTEAQ